LVRAWRSGDRSGSLRLEERLEPEREPGERVVADAIVAHEEPDAERIVHRSASAAEIDDQDDARPGGEVRRDLVVDVVGSVASIDGIGTPMSGPALRTRVRCAVFPMRDSKS